MWRISIRGEPAARDAQIPLLPMSALLNLTTSTHFSPQFPVSIPVNERTNWVPYHSYVSRPDLHPIKLEVNGTGSHGYLFFTQRGDDIHDEGLVITDDRGEPIYMDSGITKWIMSKTSFRGHGALTFWNGTLVNRHGEGAYHTYDDSYNAWNIFTTIAPGGDIHEYQLLEDETAFVTLYKTVPYNLTRFGGPDEAGFVFSCSFLRLDINSHEVLSEWDSIEYVPPDETFLTILPGEGTLDIPWDYFHINSVDLHPSGGSILLSARHTSALYNINATTGAVIWRLGGKRSDFAMGNGTFFTSQHDARWISPTEISIFDNANYKRFWPIPGDDIGSFRKQNETRGIILSLDYDTMSATLKQEYLHPSKLEFQLI